MLKKFVKKNFSGFAYFYQHLRQRIFLALGFNLTVGFLDGLGLTMFLPLLQLVDKSSGVDKNELGGLSFIVESFAVIGVNLTLGVILSTMATFFILKGIMQYVNGWYRVVVQQYFIKNLRIKNIVGLKEIDYKEFLNSDTGRIQNTLSGEVDRVSKAYQGYFQSVQFAMMVIVYMGFAFVVNAQFALLVTLGGLVTNLVYRRIYKDTKGASRKLTKDANFFQGLIIQYVSNFKYLKSTGTTSAYTDKLLNTVNDLEANNKKIGLLTALINAAREPLVVLVVVLIIYLQTTYFGSSLGLILVSLLFFYRALTYLMMMQNQWNMFLSVSGSLDNMSAFSSELVRKREKTGNVEVSTFKSKIQLQQIDVKLSGTLILKQVDLTIQKNETIAFVGESGSGKSSLVSVICGLLRPDAGKLLIDGVDSTELNIHSFQKRIGYISQDPVIFNDTIFNNVTLWDPINDHTVTRFWAAIRKASLEQFINQLPDRENTDLGNAGSNLSGGQKQRISIARELYKEIDILIMDEATSALDSQTENAIQDSLDDLKGQYTQIVIAHRFFTIRNADRIALINNGRIEFIDTFDHLLEKSEQFNRMVKMQEV